MVLKQITLWISMAFILVKVTLESISLYIPYLTVNILLYFGLAEYMEMKLIMPKKNHQNHTQYVWYTEVVLDVNRRCFVHLSFRAVFFFYGSLHTLSEVLPGLLLKASRACYLPLETLYSEQNPKKKLVLSIFNSRKFFVIFRLFFFIPLCAISHDLLLWITQCNSSPVSINTL